MAYARMTLDLNAPLKAEPEDSVFVSSCDGLDLASQGNTEEEALTNIVEAVTLFLAECAGTGTLLQVLQEIGFTALHDNQPPGEEKLADPHAIPLLIANVRPEAM